MSALPKLLLPGVAGLLLAACSGEPSRAPQAQRPVPVPPTEVADAGERLEEEYRYDPSGKPDPFKSFIKREALVPDERISPLERFDLSQLTVTGIVWSKKNARALIEDPTGKGYIVGEGAGIGKNKGRIVLIEDNRVVVKETYVDFHDRATSKEVELHLYERHGG